MAKRGSAFVCAECGAKHSKWSGRCDECGVWNAVADRSAISPGPSSVLLGDRKGAKIVLDGLSTPSLEPERTKTNVAELDRVLGGGLVRASAVLVGGAPGIGKSTLLLQMAASISVGGKSTLYFSGEEAVSQIQMRAARLHISDMNVGLAAATELSDILTTLYTEKPNVAIIDSIQTMWANTVETAPGSMSQVRSVAYELIRFAKQHGTALFLVGHVTKDGQIAGPRVVEHMVDTVLYFEGEKSHQFRLLRTVKNRFGPADEIGVFEMTGNGLASVTNPSELFLTERGETVPGSVVFAGIEGSRPLLVEIQALVAQSVFASPRRAVVGWDAGRLAMILAVLDARCGISFLGQDVYLNVVGGISVSEPAADLAVAGALVTAREARPALANSVVFGEIGLSGSLRPVPQPELRLREAAKLGFTRALTPRGRKRLRPDRIQGVTFSSIQDFVSEVSGHEQ